MKIVAFANQKGGVGKTTTAVHLAHGLALTGRRVLLVDLDPQGHVAVSLGLDKAPGLFNLICENHSLSDVIQTARPGLDILPGDKRTEQVKRMIAASHLPQTILRDLLKATPYDVVMIDMAPSLDVLHINGLVASDWVLIPTRPDALAMDGVREVLLTMAEVAQEPTGGTRKKRHKFEGYAVLPTFFDRTTRETLTQLQEMVNAFGERVWPPIPQDTALREAAAYGRTLFEYRPSAKAMTGYRDGRKRSGGYRQAIDHLIAVLDE